MKGGLLTAAAYLVAAVCLTGALLAQGGRFSSRLDIFCHFAPLWLTGAFLTGVWGIVIERGAARGLLLAIAAGGVVAAGALMARELTRPAPATAPPTGRDGLRLIQFNAWGLNRDPQAVADWIADQKPDVVAIEELTPALHAALTRHGFIYQQGMTLSVAIFSRVPPGSGPFIVPAAYWPILPEFARAAFPAPGRDGTFDVVAVHLAWPTNPRFWRQALHLADFLDLYAPDRLILAGDFNLTPWSFSLRRLDGRLGMQRRDRALASWPANLSVGGRLYPSWAWFPIDHVYAGPAWRTVAVRRGPSLGSDHYPLVVDLALEK